MAGAVAGKFPLSKAPDGLLGALDLKSIGQNPQWLLDDLSPSLDVMSFYLLRNRLAIGLAGPFVAVNTVIVFAAGTGVAAPYSSGGFFVVPQKEVIRLKQVSIICARAAADAALTLEYQLVVRRVSAPTLVSLGAVQLGARPATDLTTAASFPLNEYLWFGPGDSLGLLPNTTQTAAGSAISLQLDFDTMPSG